MKQISIIFLSFLIIACGSNSMNAPYQSKNMKNGIFENVHTVKMHSFWEVVWGNLTSETGRAEWPEELKVAEDKSPLSRTSENETRITFINHATFLIQSAGFNILTDPVFSARTSPLSFIGPKRIHTPGIALDDLPPIDMVIISHDHYDHLDLNSIKKLIHRDDPKIYAGLGVGKRLKGSTKITELDWWHSSQVEENFKIWFLDVQHFSGRSLFDRNTTLWGSYMLEINDQKIYFGGDSGYSDHYQRTFEHFGPIDIAFLPIGAYAPRKFFKSVHMNPEEAVQAHTELQAEVSVAMHYGTFQLSAEPFNEPVKRLEKAKADAGIKSSGFIALEIGIPYQFSDNSLSMIKQ
ncbi:MBL fold metallo-hydrolase [Aliamphritea ceti]|uniref:MBL fold metallo-hydrolase n=1 Tax=Aliamphritea ceti TaxID=1524258 RepID=UPI0021C29A01|nr:MBL fold metallo-hydrolase [Aliamphritea ceti]